MREGLSCPFYRWKSSRTKRCFSDEMTHIMFLIVLWWLLASLPVGLREERRAQCGQGYSCLPGLGGQGGMGDPSPSGVASGPGVLYHPQPRLRGCPPPWPPGPPSLVYSFRPLVSFSVATLFCLLWPVTYSPGSGHHRWEWRGLERLGGSLVGRIPS